MNHCATNCYGKAGQDGGCCKLEDRNYVIGPIPDAAALLERLRQRFGNPDLKHEDVFFDFAEGSRLFADRSHWQDPKCYPALRVDTTRRDYPCVFYNRTVKACSIYEDRSVTCRNFTCDWLKGVLAAAPAAPAAPVTPPSGP